MEKMLHFHGTIFKLIFIILGLTCMIPYGYGGSSSRQKVLEVKRKLKHLRKHSLKTIQSEDGDIIDCIDIYKQPAFDHPALKHHKIQIVMSFNFQLKKYDLYIYNYQMAPTCNTTKTKMGSMSVTSQVWQKSGRCPEGTIPVRRIRKRDLLKAHSIEDYGRKKPSISPQDVHNLDSSVSVERQNHSKAIVFTVGYRYLGAKGDIRVFQPFVETDDEYTTSQVALVNGAFYDFESIEAGWAVNPSVYGDKQTRLFVYWTVDGSTKTGCFDLTCPGFVQTSNEVALGAAINPISIPSDIPFAMTIYIYKDPITNKWWLQYDEERMVGYWPPELFRGMKYQAESVEWGGEVYSTRVGTSPHTRTQMGSGQFPTVPFWDYCGTVSRMRIQDNSAILKSPPLLQPFTDEYNCYEARYVSDYVEDPEFYYGGPGRNPSCP
ncbi:putative neprosin [Senna tora]|uniref:Putative neprosin n=1 Tax=Senna tora TaxID=362788 RepID=A0A834U442_9FABA|nr:putative neprosin [Senna tora]